MDTLFQETFSLGMPSNWTVGTGEPSGATWQWSPNGRADTALHQGGIITALFWNNRPAIASPTGSTGAAMYNSDAYDSAGQGIGQGPFPGPHMAHLITPNIDCSAAERVYLQFHQFARALNNFPSTRVSVSNDGGDTWQYIPLWNPPTENGSTSPDNKVLLDISSVAGNADNVRVRFTWEGRYYFWLLDDVQLITPPPSELQLNAATYPASSFATPISQLALDSFNLGASIANLGSEATENAAIYTHLVQRNGTLEEILSSDTTLLPSIPPFQADTSVEIIKQWPDELEIGDYIVRYELANAADFNLFNNTLEYPFRITNFDFAKEDDVDIGARPLAGGDYTLANLYRTGPEQQEEYIAESVIFAAVKDSIDGPLSGEFVTLSLFVINDSIADDFSNFDLNSFDDLTLLGLSGFVFPPGSDDLLIFESPLIGGYGTPILLQPSTRYLVTILYEGSASTIFGGFNDDLPYQPLSTLLFYDNEWFLGGFGPGQAAVLRLRIRPRAMTQRETEDFVGTPPLSAFPNPASDQLHIQHPTARAATLMITNSQGQLVHLQDLPNQDMGTTTINVSQWPSGVYWLQLFSEGGTEQLGVVVE